MWKRSRDIVEGWRFMMYLWGRVRWFEIDSFEIKRGVWDFEVKIYLFGWLSRWVC